MQSRAPSADRSALRASRARRARRGSVPAALLASVAALAAPAAALAQGSLSDMVAGEANQGPVSLVADRIEYDNPNNTLTAEGNVVV